MQTPKRSPFGAPVAQASLGETFCHATSVSIAIEIRQVEAHQSMRMHAKYLSTFRRRQSQDFLRMSLHRRSPAWMHSRLSNIGLKGPKDNSTISPSLPLSSWVMHLISGSDMTAFDHFREFENFLEGVGLPAGWTPHLNENYHHDGATIAAPRASRATSATPANTCPSPRHEVRLGTPFSYWLPSALPSNSNGIPSDPQSNVNLKHRAIPESERFRVNDEQRMQLVTSLEEFREVIGPSFQLPSRHSLTRYITSYFQGFHTHMNFIHVPTWSISETPLESLLAIATIGAQYCFEHKISNRLFSAGKSILIERLAHEADRLGPRLGILLSLAKSQATARAKPWAAEGSCTGVTPWEPLDAIKTLINLMGFATWEPNESLLREAFGLRELLANVCRDVGLEEPPVSPGPGCDQRPNSTSPKASWLSWIREESRRRTKLIAFSFTHIHSVAYNVYPVIRTSEVRLRLPCPTEEWKAPTASQWEMATSEARKQQLNYQEALSLLLHNVDEPAPLDPIPTPLGNYLLLHGILQRIFIVRDLSLPIMDEKASLPKEEVEKLERALRSWTMGWQQAPESSLDPNNENGPIPFTSSSVLSLAYTRIYLDLGPYRALETRDTDCVARTLMRSPDLSRSSGVTSALLYATHALSIPVRLGLDRVARSQALFWSIRHALSGLECAVLLSKWLSSLGRQGVEGLTDSEERILHWVRRIVQEAWAVVDFDEDDNADIIPAVEPSPKILSFAVLKIWAHFFKGNTQWRFINMIGESLEKYRRLLIEKIT
ncbi:hypothetical protein VPNG_05873 [Cytospora leucostoma]|uniref:Xylanolytic transcriptional activator regulatory domain-containing protein n=1 Tax=Cytospora leucostoma TaxID=1230097 RepID=A0A423X0E3_9PEZI|nr:hypothetical protein VPNG_05873 [Cytospora leucostoma]